MEAPWTAIFRAGSVRVITKFITFVMKNFSSFWMFWGVHCSEFSLWNVVVLVLSGWDTDKDNSSIHRTSLFLHHPSRIYRQHHITAEPRLINLLPLQPKFYFNEMWRGVFSSWRLLRELISPNTSEYDEHSFCSCSETSYATDIYCAITHGQV